MYTWVNRAEAEAKWGGNVDVSQVISLGGFQQGEDWREDQSYTGKLIKEDPAVKWMDR